MLAFLSAKLEGTRRNLSGQTSCLMNFRRHTSCACSSCLHFVPSRAEMARECVASRAGALCQRQSILSPNQSLLGSALSIHVPALRACPGAGGVGGTWRACRTGTSLCDPAKRFDTSNAAFFGVSVRVRDLLLQHEPAAQRRDRPTIPRCSSITEIDAAYKGEELSVRKFRPKRQERHAQHRRYATLTDWLLLSNTENALWGKRAE